MIVKIAMVRWEDKFVRGGFSEYIVKVMVNVGEATRVNWVAIDMEQVNLIL